MLCLAIIYCIYFNVLYIYNIYIYIYWYDYNMYTHVFNVQYILYKTLYISHKYILPYSYRICHTENKFTETYRIFVVWSLTRLFLFQFFRFQALERANGPVSGPVTRALHAAAEFVQGAKVGSLNEFNGWSRDPPPVGL